MTFRRSRAGQADSDWLSGQGSRNDQGDLSSDGGTDVVVKRRHGKREERPGRG